MSAVRPIEASSPASSIRIESLATQCFHCHEPLAGSTLSARINGEDEPVCCQGCRAVAELIAGAGLADYYLLRDSPGARPDAVDNASDTWTALSQPDVAAQFTRRSGDSESVVLSIDGLRCAACGWLIDHVLKSTPGIREATTNSATGRTYVQWQQGSTTLGDICRRIGQLGYRFHPLKADGTDDTNHAEHRDALKRLAVAGLGMMQVMMFAVATYCADLAGEVIDAPLLKLFRYVSLLVATPVMFYAATPVFAAARRNLQTRTIGMDIPVAIALSIAYAASVWNTFRGVEAKVYFDSVTMFVFFLMLARFVQMSVRQRTVESTEALARQLPNYAHKMELNTVCDVPLAALQVGDTVMVKPGEVVPADGTLLDTEAILDEAILSGESLPVRRSRGNHVAAGTINVGAPFCICVAGVAQETLLSHIASLQQRAQAQKPALAKAADAAAARFLRYVLMGSGLTCAAWLYIDPTRAFEITLSVLIVACPCAFAIAMPAAISAVTAHLARLGVLVTRIDALETLTHVDRFVLDKTGTLTRGDIVIRRCVASGRLSENNCLKIAAALELKSEHPLARAFAGLADGLQASQVRTIAGAGVEGVIDGRRYRIGTPQFVAKLRGELLYAGNGAETQHTVVVLGDEQQELALFALEDTPRPSAVTFVESLRRRRIATQILSGDSSIAVANIARYCGVPEFRSRCSPEQKLAHVQALQAQGHRVAMVGDGVNDAPVLASADLSIAMGSGAALAHASADMILVTENLDCLPEAIDLVRRAQAIARQNLRWSALYNFGSLPLAAAGLISPWLAALGMSLSSIAVVLNAARLLPHRNTTSTIDRMRLRAQALTLKTEYPAARPVPVAARS